MQNVLVYVIMLILVIYLNIIQEIQIQMMELTVPYSINLQMQVLPKPFQLIQVAEINALMHG